MSGGDFREAYRSPNGCHIVWTEGGVQDARVPEIVTQTISGTRLWRAKLPYRDDSLRSPDEMIAILEADAEAARAMAEFIRRKEAEYVGPAETFGARLKRLRTERGLTLAELAEMIGTEAGNLCATEKGRLGRGMPLARFRRLAKVFEMTMDELADGLAGLE